MVDRLRYKSSQYIRVHESGSYNGSIVPLKNRFLLAYRSDPRHVKVAFLDRDLHFIHGTTSPILGAGHMDPRLFTMGDRILLSTAFRGKDGKTIVALSEIDTFLNSVRVRGTRYLENGPCDPRPKAKDEKNWTFLTHQGELFLIYAIQPHRLFKLPEGSNEPEEVDEIGWLNHYFWKRKKLRGSTNPIGIVDGKLLSMFHTREGDKYYSGFYLLENYPPFRPTAYSPLPCFSPSDAESRQRTNATLIFPMSLMEIGGSIFVCTGDNDSSIRLFEFEKSRILDSLVSATVPQPQEETETKESRRSSGVIRKRVFKDPRVSPSPIRFRKGKFRTNREET